MANRTLKAGTALLALLLSASHPLCAQRREGNDLSSLGLNGPVRSITMKLNKLAEDPRKDAQVFVGDRCYSCTFDLRGYFTEQDSATSDGVVTRMTRYVRDPSGAVVESRDFDANGKLVGRTAVVNGPNGPLSEETWVGDRMVERSTRESSGGRRTETRFQNDRHDVVEISETEDESGHPIHRVTRKNGKVTGEAVHRYGEDGNELDWIEYDGAGNVILHAEFRKGTLTSWWMKPNSFIRIGFDAEEDGIWVNYNSGADGRLSRTVYESQSRPGYRTPNEVRRYDADGRLQEKVTFEYRFDSYQNWISRIMHVWNLTTGKSVAVERATRTITYY